LTCVDVVDTVNIDKRKCIAVLLEEESMSRVQLALNVADLDASIEFYTKLFRTPPAKVRDGYANFAIADPPLKLVLFAGAGEPGSLNHIGVEVESTDEVSAVIARTQADGFEQEVQENTSCCYAVQDKTWVRGPDNDWEFYTVLADAPTMSCESCLPTDMFN
jgi:catechol 2,3-dioxygenase-like lactoylglutathione lyase family enzyme